MVETPSQDLNHASFEHAWKWFEYHANQRMTMIRFYLIVEGAVAAGIGFVWIHHEFFFSSLLSAFGVLASLCFLRLDRRVAHLVKFGEAALKERQRQIALATENPHFEICKMADESRAQDGRRRFLYPYTYGENIRLLLGSAMLAFTIALVASLFSLLKPFCH